MIFLWAYVVFWSHLIVALVIRDKEAQKEHERARLFIDKETGIKIWYPKGNKPFRIILNNVYPPEVVALINCEEDYYRVLKMKVFW